MSFQTIQYDTFSLKRTGQTRDHKRLLLKAFAPQLLAAASFLTFSLQSGDGEEDVGRKQTANSSAVALRLI